MWGRLAAAAAVDHACVGRGDGRDILWVMREGVLWQRGTGLMISHSKSEFSIAARLGCAQMLLAAAGAVLSRKHWATQALYGGARHS
jgi:hypothetical protein